MDEIEIPHYFICPISLQLMKDPVTTITGITYDRDSIEHWLYEAKNTTCPVTKQPLIMNIPTVDSSSDLTTPNHTLCRLIQSWCTQNAVDQIPTPRPPLDKCQVTSLINDLRRPNLQLKTLRKLEVFALKHERNQKCMVEAGVVKAMGLFIVTCYEKCDSSGLEEALSIFNFVRSSSSKTKTLVSEDDRIIDALVWVLGRDIDNHVTVKSHAVLVLKTIVGKASSYVLERLKPKFFESIIRVLKGGNISRQGINAALQIMLDTSPWCRNRITMVESGAVFELIELELSSPEKRTTELVLGVLFHLCSCADGREKLLSHEGGVAVVTKRLLKVSPAANDRAMLILSMVSRFSGTDVVVQEMLRVGTFTKMCMVLQGGCASYLKDKAKEILRAHVDVWKDSPCIEATTLLSI